MRQHWIIILLFSDLIVGMTFAYLGIRLQAVHDFVDRIAINQTKILQHQQKMLGLLSGGK